MTPEEMLREFHTVMELLPMPEVPTTDIPPAVQSLREELLYSEYMELTGALADQDIVGIADAIADMVYVLVGTAITHGIPFDRVFAEVHRSNMTKERLADREPGQRKLVKGPGYEPPQLTEILAGTAE